MEANTNCRELLTARDLMERYGFPRVRVYELLNRADLPVVPIGRRRYMHKQLFDEWLRNQASGNVLEAHA